VHEIALYWCFFVVAAAMFFTYPSLRPTIFAKSSNRKINNPQTIQNPPQPHPEFGVPAPKPATSATCFVEFVAEL
jgi:hypothetical protein